MATSITEKMVKVLRFSRQTPKKKRDICQIFDSQALSADAKHAGIAFLSWFLNTM